MTTSNLQTVLNPYVNGGYHWEAAESFSKAQMTAIGSCLSNFNVCLWEFLQPPAASIMWSKMLAIVQEGYYGKQEGLSLLILEEVVSCDSLKLDRRQGRVTLQRLIGSECHKLS